MATSEEIPKGVQASGIRSNEPPATPLVPQAPKVARKHTAKAEDMAPGIPSVCTVGSVITVMVIAAPLILMVAPSGIDTE